MTRKNKKKNQNKPIKIKPPPSSSGPPGYSQLDYINQKPSEPPPYTSLDYAIPRNTEPDFNGVLKKKLRQSFQMWGKGGDDSVGAPKTGQEILEMLSYPVPEENFEDFIVHKRELRELLDEEDDDKIANLLKKAVSCAVGFGSTSPIKTREFILYCSYGECPQKEFIQETHEDLHRIYRGVLERNVNEELRKCIEYVDTLENKEEIEKSCSTKKSLLEFFAKNPSHYLQRELFKSCLLFCDLIGITVRTHMALINELEDSFTLDGLPRNHLLPQIDQGLDQTRQNRDVQMHHMSHAQRIILAKLAEKMPNFLGSAVMEYVEYDENVKKWNELKVIREEEIATKPRMKMSVDSLLNADLKFRRFARPTSATQIDMLREILERRNDMVPDDPAENGNELLGDSQEAMKAREELAASLPSFGIAPLTVERMMKELKDLTIE